jgi:hypothetical protein
VKRPFGFTILALLFAWLTVAGVAYAFAATQLAQSQIDSLHLSRPVMIISGMAYGVTALASCAGLWLNRPWVRRAILIWGGVLLLVMAAVQGMIGVRGEPWWLAVLPYLLLGGIAALIHQYVARRYRSFERAI